MTNTTTFANELIQRMIALGKISPPLTIQAELGTSLIQAQLQYDGSVILQGRQFTDIHQAMIAAHKSADSTSNAWQFWSQYNQQYNTWMPLEHQRAQLQSESRENELRTSDSHPLRIDTITLPNPMGRIGLTFCPGKRGQGLYSGRWERDLQTDLNTIKAWGAHTLVSLIALPEFDRLAVHNFGDSVRQNLLEWRHWPIKDMQTPDLHFEQTWQREGQILLRQIQAGAAVVIHCWGGLGRTGLVAARILVELGATPVEAVAQVRATREHTIETYAQEMYVLTQAWQNNR